MQVLRHPRLVALLLGLIAALVVVPPALGWETADSGGTVSEPAPEETQGAEAAPEEHADPDADLGIMDQSSQEAADAAAQEAPPAAPPADDDDHGRDEDDDVGLMENQPGAGATPLAGVFVSPAAGGCGVGFELDEEANALRLELTSWTAPRAREHSAQQWAGLAESLQVAQSKVLDFLDTHPGHVSATYLASELRRYTRVARQNRAYQAAKKQVTEHGHEPGWKAQLTPPKGLPTEDKDKVTLLDQDSAVDRLFPGTGQRELVEELLSDGLKEWSPLPQSPAVTPEQGVDLGALRVERETESFPLEAPSPEAVVTGGTTALGLGATVLLLRSIDGAEKFCAFPGACGLDGP